MVTQNMLRKLEENQVFPESKNPFVAAIYLIKCLKQKSYPTSFLTTVEKGLSDQNGRMLFLSKNNSL